MANFTRIRNRIGSLPSHVLASFISYRSNPNFTKALLGLRPDIWKRLDSFYSPLKDDMDVDLISALHSQGLLPEERRVAFVSTARMAANENADDSFLACEKISAMLTDSERAGILDEVETRACSR